MAGGGLENAFQIQGVWLALKQQAAGRMAEDGCGRVTQGPADALGHFLPPRVEEEPVLAQMSSR